MVKVYCDHNFLINAFAENDAYKERLRAVVEAGAIQFVLSTWHWVEMAKDENTVRGLHLADFADSLRPLWLRDRTRIQADEVANSFFAFMNLQYTPTPPISTLATVIAEITEKSEKITARYTQSRPFVQHLQTPQGTKELAHAYSANFDSQKFLRDARHRSNHQHRLTRPLRRKVDREWLKQLLPVKTPAGVKIDRKTRRAFLAQNQPQDFRCLAVESALSQDAVELDRALPEREFRDRQHAMSIPYVEFLVTNDGRLAKTVARIAPELSFKTAVIIDKAGFDHRFL